MAVCGSLSYGEMCIPGTKLEGILAQRRNSWLSSLFTMQYIDRVEKPTSGNSNQNESC